VNIENLGDLTAMSASFRTVQAAEAWHQHGDWVNAHPGVLGADIAARFAFASLIGAAEEEDARADVAEARTRLDNVLAGRILLLPSASSVAPARSLSAQRIDQIRAATLSMTCIAGIGGYPALSVPLWEIAGAPIGLCLVGPRFSDLDLLGRAEQF
jgi:Asp-tRNA(Asn)/Glu-tRNA(Gln) amidotransferase A subunit family amidase